MMSRERAQALAATLCKLYPKERRRIDADAVRLFCTASSDGFAEALDGEWLEHGPLHEVAAAIDVRQLVR